MGADSNAEKSCCKGDLSASLRFADYVPAGAGYVLSLDWPNLELKSAGTQLTKYRVRCATGCAKLLPLHRVDQENETHGGEKKRE